MASVDRYTGALNTQAASKSEAEQKLPLLYEEFGIDPADPAADRKTLLALAERHVPGFRTRMSPSAPGRPKVLKDLAQEIANDTLLSYQDAEGLVRDNLRKVVIRLKKQPRSSRETKRTQKEWCELISVTEFFGTEPNPYYGIEAATLLSIVTHSGPRSEFGKTRARLLRERMDRVVNFLSAVPVAKSSV